MRRVVPLAAPGAALVLALVSFRAVLFGGEQFAYRDAGHFYYPLYQRVQQEWAAGRLPLWEPEENAGQPLLGNPTAAVLYPGKLVFALAPSYAWGVRLYTLAHVALAFVAMYLLMRHWETSRAGSGLSALAYAFGTPVLFQYCNIVFLVGAAWAPLALRAIDAWVRLGRRLALAELGIVLALQALGGEPQAAYVEGLCAAGYALGLAWANRPGRRPWPRWRVAAAVAGVVVAWSALAILGAAEFPKARAMVPGQPPEPLPWMPALGWAVRLGWAALAVAVAIRLARGRGRGLPGVLAGLLGAAALAGALAAAQLVPVMEFTGQSVRAAGQGPHDYYPFSVEPARVLEFAFPNVFGTMFHGFRSWLPLVPPVHVPQFWVPSLYLGGPTLVLALAAFGFRGGPPWRAWLAGIALVSLLAGLGRFASPVWVGRNVPALEAQLGRHDVESDTAIRFDGKLRDGDGGVYWLMATALPGFKEFRFPGKMLTFTCLALAALAGLGWDRVAAGRARAATLWASALLALGLAGLAFALAARGPILERFASGSLAPASPGAEAADMRTALGAFEPRGAWADLAFALGQGGVAFAATLALLALARRRPELAAAGLAALLAADLGLANAGSILTVPQSMFDEPPELVRLIERFERESPTPGGLYRVHRMPAWEPLAWRESREPGLYRKFVEWERKTVQPKYGIPYGLNYVFTEGTAELYDYVFFFGAFRGVGPFARQQAAKALDDPGEGLVAFARRSFDLWNARYFILPTVLANDENRGFGTFVMGLDVERLYPPRDRPISPDWERDEDWQLYRNKSAYPRAWAVHQAKIIRPIVGLDRKDRKELIEEITYQSDPLWSETTATGRPRPVYDPREMAWVEADDPGPIREHLPPGRAGRDARDRVEVTRHEPARVEIAADLAAPGLVVLADAYYPGWRLTIDGQPRPILRTNRMMRGALVGAGPHTLVFRYDPPSLRVGLTLTVLGLFALVALGVWSFRRPAAPADGGPDADVPPPEAP
jgi:hypothetical protein